MKLIKHLLFSLSILSLSLFAVSCNDDDEAAPTLISFGTNSLNVNENDSSVISVPVVLGAAVQSASFTVDFTVSGDASASDYTILNDNNQLTFEVGQESATIRFQVTNNYFNDNDRSFLISLSAVSDDNFSLAVPGESQPAFVATIVDDDCEFDRDGFVALYNVQITGHDPNNPQLVQYQAASAVWPEAPVDFVVRDVFFDGDQVAFRPNTCGGYMDWDEEAIFYVHPDFGVITLQRADFNNWLVEAGLNFDPEDPSQWSGFDVDARSFYFYGRVWIPGSNASFGVFRWDFTKP